MNIIQIDRLSRQNQHKTQTINRLINQIQCYKNDIRAQKQLISRIQSQKVQYRKQIQYLKRKNEQLIYEQQNKQSRYLMVLQKLQQQISDSKKKYNKLNNKISPLIDYDSVRLSILAQLSQQHQLQQQKYKHIIQMQKDQIHQLRRQNSLLEHKLNTIKIDYQDKIRLLNNNVKNELSQNQLSALSLQMSKDIQNKLKLSYQTIRKQAQYYKDKYFTTQKKYQSKLTILEKQIIQLKSNLH